MVSKLVISVADYGTPVETSTFSVKGTAITAATHDAVKAQMQALADALDDITLGNRYKTDFRMDLVENVPLRPASPYAQRENKWLVTYHTSGLGVKGTVEVPCADLSLIDPATDGLADVNDANGYVQAFIDAFEAYVKVGAESVVVESLRFVARNI